MMQLGAIDWIVAAWTVVAILLVPILFFVTAPYGRHAPAPRGPTLPSRVGWIVMESPSVIGVILSFVLWPRGDVAAFALAGLFLLHYINRTYVYPFRLRGGQKPMPLAIVGSAFCFTSVNGLLQGWQLTHGSYALEWLRDPRFLLGAALFLLGFAMNQHADAVLRRLRAPGETGYKIPKGGMYRWVSCPNYLGEIIEWSGWAIATWSLAGLSFAIWTVANLLPRARAHHRWYLEKFPDYPKERRALIPFTF
jgi:3-oxo-5-alpha-steroid 4-dehydrogenase 1